MKYLTVKLLLDLLMTALFLLCLGFRFTTEVFHEWAGVMLFILFIVHIWLNRRWCSNLLKGVCSLRRVMNTLVNFCLIGLMLMLLLGGLINSQILRFLELDGSMLYREWHTFTAYWGLILVGIHLGMHWPLLAGLMRKKSGRLGRHRAFIISVHILWLGIVLAGVWSFFDRDMIAKLFMGYGFDYWDEDRPVFLFYLSMGSIMALCAVMTHYSLRLLYGLSVRLGVARVHSK